MAKTEKDIISAYVAETENEEQYVEKVPVRKNPIESPLTRGDYDRIAEELDNKRKNNLGYLNIPVTELPTKGLFYPEGIKILIRAARGEEIKHWSTMNDRDIEAASRNDDIFNYMLEKCCSVKIDGQSGNCWKDLVNIDRFYIILAIREFTFTDNNPLMVPYGEGKDDIPVTKEMIDYIKFPDELMRFYDHDTKGFKFEIDGQIINMYIPTIGVNDWVKKYAETKSRSGELFDKDFLLYAAMLVKDYRKLNFRTYEDLVASTRSWGHKEWSVVSYVFDLLSGITAPKIKYTDENGTEVEIPLNFRGGIKAIFLLSNPLLSLC